MKTKALSIIKPDAVQRGLQNEILTELLSDGFQIHSLMTVNMTLGEAQRLYKVHETKPFFDDLCEFMTTGPCVWIALEREDCPAQLRKLVAKVRAKHATSVQHNVIHGSDSDEAATYELTTLGLD